MEDRGCTKTEVNNLNKMDIIGVSLVACPANGESLERAEEIKNATHFKKLENKNNTNNR